MRLLLLMVLAAGALAAAERTWPCEAGPAAEEVLHKYRNPPNGSAEEKKSFRRKLLEDALREYPDDLFLHRQLQKFAGASDDAMVEKYHALADTHADDSFYLYLYGAALVSRKKDDAVKFLSRSVELDARNPWPHLALSDVYQYGRLVDKQKSMDETARFWAICPASLDSGALEAALERSTPETAAKIARGVRERLAKIEDSELLERYSTLWDLELKGTPPSRQAERRKIIAADVARLRAMQPPNRTSWFQLLKAGAKDSGDLEAAKAADDEILKRFPTSSAALSILRARFRDEHPYNKDASETEKQKYVAARLAFAEEMLRKWPGDVGLMIERFDAVLGDNEVAPGKMQDIAESFLHHVWEHHDAFGYPPLEFRAAETYIHRGLGLSRVPELVDRGIAGMEWRLEDDRKHDEAPRELENMRKSMDHFRVEALRILIDLYSKTNEPQKAVAALAEARKHEPKDGFEAPFYRQAARAAELNGSKLDALVYLQNAMDRWKGPAKEKTEIAAGVDRLWKDLGGTPEARQLWARKPSIVEADSDMGWRKPEGALTSFDLEDTTGKVWSLKSLVGKTVAINVWATWCGFCVAEHPAFQKLYDRVKDRKDVVLLTFNVDESLAEIEPYMKKNGYTFPVIPAEALVNTVLPVVGIPRNWVFNPKGEFLWEQIGYNADNPDWEKDFLKILGDSK